MICHKLWRLEGTLEVSGPTKKSKVLFWLELHHMHSALSPEICKQTPFMDPRTDLLPYLVGSCRCYCHCHCQHTDTTLAIDCVGGTLFVFTMEQLHSYSAFLPISVRKLLRSCSSEQQRAGEWEAMTTGCNRRCSAWWEGKGFLLMKTTQQFRRGQERLCHLHPRSIVSPNRIKKALSYLVWPHGWVCSAMGLDWSLPKSLVDCMNLWSSAM